MGCPYGKLVRLYSVVTSDRAWKQNEGDTSATQQYYHLRPTASGKHK